MRHRFLFSIIAFLFVGTMACENDLDLLPQDTLVKGSFFKTENEFKLFSNTFYLGLPGFGRCNRDNNADIAFAGSSISNSTYIEPQADGAWNNAYTAIRRYNDLFEQFALLEEGAIKESVKIYKAEAEIFTAMTYFGLLVKFGGVPLVKRTLALDSEELYAPRNSFTEVADFIIENLDLAISSQKLGSLTGAADQGRITHNAALAFKSRVCLYVGTWAKFHATGADANKYLTLAKDAAKKVIDSNNYQLFKRDDVLGSVDESYRYLFSLESDVKSNPAGLGKDDQSEFILVRRYAKTLVEAGYISLRSGNLSPTKTMADMFLDNTGLPIDHASSVFEGHGFTIDETTKKVDNIEFNNRDPRMDAVFLKPFEQFWYHSPYHRDFSSDVLIGTGAWNDGLWTSNTGYLMNKMIPETEGGSVTTDYAIIRYAEVLLNYAEATYELEGSISDEDLNLSINQLRDRVDMPHLTNAFVGTNGLDMRNELRRERTVELCFEGFRYDDLRRWKTAEVEMSKDVRGVQWTASVLPTAFEVYNERLGEVATVKNHVNTVFKVDADGFILRETSGERKFQANKHYLAPLPLRQLAINPQLEQNPNWSAQ